MGVKKEDAHGPRQLLQLAQPRQNELPEFVGTAQSGAGHAVMLDAVPHLFVGIQLRRVRRQRKQPQLAAREHEAQLVARTDHRDHIHLHRAAPPGRAHHWSLALDPLGGSSVMLRTHTSVVPPIGSRAHPPRLSANHRVLLFQLPPHLLRILFPGAPQGALTAQSQLPQQAGDRGQAQAQPNFLPRRRADHLSRPRRELKTTPQWALASDGAIQPTLLHGLEFQQPTRQPSSLQGIPAAVAVVRQRGVNATAREPQGLNHYLRAFPGLHALHRTDADLFQGLLINTTAIAAFHASLSHLLTCELNRRESSFEGICYAMLFHSTAFMEIP